MWPSKTEGVTTKMMSLSSIMCMVHSFPRRNCTVQFAKLRATENSPNSAASLGVPFMSKLYRLLSSARIYCYKRSVSVFFAEKL